MAAGCRDWDAVQVDTRSGIWEAAHLHGATVQQVPQWHAPDSLGGGRHCRAPALRQLQSCVLVVSPRRPSEGSKIVCCNSPVRRCSARARRPLGARRGRSLLHCFRGDLLGRHRALYSVISYQLSFFGLLRRSSLL